MVQKLLKAFFSMGSILEEFNLVGKKWLKDLFSLKEKLALAYGRQFFCATFLRRSLKRKYDSWRFLKGYEKALEHRRAIEVDEDFNSRHTYLARWADVDMLKQIANVYTRNVYNMFEE